MEWIEVSKHAGERWHEHTTHPGVGPVVAWNRGIPLVAMDGLDGEEARVLEDVGDEGVVMVRKDDTMVTVVNVATASPAVQGVVDATLERWEGIHESS